MAVAGHAMLVLVVLAAACTSPEATRARGGGQGGDPGNRSEIVEIHAGAQPYWETPRLIPEGVEAPIRAARSAEGVAEEGEAAASPAGTRQ
jgi:hypothetical protein